MIDDPQLLVAVPGEGDLVVEVACLELGVPSHRQRNAHPGSITSAPKYEEPNYPKVWDPDGCSSWIREDGLV
jgi:hypothetical protein